MRYFNQSENRQSGCLPFAVTTIAKGAIRTLRAVVGTTNILIGVNPTKRREVSDVAITIDENELPSGFSKAVIRRFMDDQQFGEFVLKYEENKLISGRVTRFAYLEKEIEPEEKQLLEDWFDGSLSIDDTLNRYNSTAERKIKKNSLGYLIRSIALRFLFQSNRNLR